MQIPINTTRLAVRVAYMTAMVASVTLFGGATWSIDSPTTGSYRTATSSVAGNGTAGQTGTAVLQFGDELGGFVVENEMNVTAQSIGMGMYSWSGDLSSPNGGWSTSPEMPGMPGSYIGTHAARIKWIDNGNTKTRKTNQHVVAP